MKKLLLFFLFVPLASFGQTNDEMQLCLAAQGTSFYSDSEAENALDRILSVVSLAKNFSLVPCDNINNAYAVSFKGERYILYDKAFMRAISSRTNNWSSLTILAHEVAHHLNNHAVDIALYKIIEPKTLAKKRKQELEADEFAGFIMAKLGAPLNQVKEAIALISSDKDDTYSTHPSKGKRINAIKEGWNKGKSTTRVVITNDNTSSKTKSKNSYVKNTSTWMVNKNNDPFSSTGTLISNNKGKIVGNSKYIKESPTYIIRKVSSKIWSHHLKGIKSQLPKSWDLERSNIYGEVIIMDINGNKVFEYDFNLDFRSTDNWDCWLYFKNIYDAGGINNEYEKKLKTGSKLLIKIKKYVKVKGIDESFGEYYIEYSLSGSSKLMGSVKSGWL